MSYLRFTVAALLAATAVLHGADLFTDSFDRPNSNDLDAVTNGMGGMLITNGTLAAGGTWLEPIDAGIPDDSKSLIAANEVVLAAGFGTSHGIVNHNFAGTAPSGSLTVLLEVTDINPGTDGEPEHRYLGFGIGFTDAEGNVNGDRVLAREADLFVAVTQDGRVRINDGNEDARPGGAAVSPDVLYDINAGSTAFVAGTIRAELSYLNTSLGTVVAYDVFFDDDGIQPEVQVVDDRTFTWSDDDELRIGLDGRASGDVRGDNLQVSFQMGVDPVASITASPDTVNSGNTNQVVVLDWTAANVPTGATYVITADQPGVLYAPNGSESGSLSSPVDSGTVNTTVNGTLGNTTFTLTLKDNTTTLIASDTVTVSQLASSVTLNATPVEVPETTNAPVTLTWSGTDLPLGATYQITADQPVTFPGVGDTGSITNEGATGGVVAATVDGTLDSTTFTITVYAGAMPVAVAQDSVFKQRPNVIVILLDDLGWSDFGCYGSFIHTPNIDSLAAGGVRFRNFYQAARCSPTRNAILTGLYTQQAAVDPGVALPNLKDHGHAQANNVTIPEVLGPEGFRTYMSGKWHLGTSTARQPRNRGFDHVFGQGVNGAGGNESGAFAYWIRANYSLVNTAGSPDTEFAAVNDKYDETDNDGDGKPRFHYTRATGDYAVDFINHSVVTNNDDQPFFIYMSFNAPHWPVQGPADLADRYTDVGDATPDGVTTNGGLDGGDFVHYEDGWDVLRLATFNAQLSNGVVDGAYTLSPKGDHPDGSWPGNGSPEDWGTSRSGNPIDDWNTLSSAQHNDLARRMACYAASIEQVDQNIGKVRTRLAELGELDNTLILLCSDNGANYEGGEFGNSSSSSFTPWAVADLPHMAQPQNANNTSYSRVNEGGAWANFSNIPFRMFKHHTHEGGIRTPAIIHWPARTAPGVAGTWTDERGHLVDFMATAVAATGGNYPGSYAGHAVDPMEGTSLLPVLQGNALAPLGIRALGIGVEHEHNIAFFQGDWKLTRRNGMLSDGSETPFSLQLYNLAQDPTELNDLAVVNTPKAAQMVNDFITWATHVGVVSERIPEPIIPRVDPAALGVDLFVDTFNRPAHTDHDNATNGMSGVLVPSSLGAGTTYYDSWEPKPDVDTAIVNGGLMMAAGPNMTETAVQHNFGAGATANLITSAGGFAVQLRVDLIDAGSATNRWVGFGVGLTHVEAQASADFIATSPPLSFRGNGPGKGAADFFVELDKLGQVKTFLNGAPGATVAVGSSTGTLLACFELSGGPDGFLTSQPVTVTVYFNGTQVDLGGPGGTASFNWDANNSNYIGLSSRASTRAVMDNFAIRTLPLAETLANEYAIAAGLTGTDSALGANPEGDRDSNVVEWLKGGSPAAADDDRKLFEVGPSSLNDYRFKRIRLLDAAKIGVSYSFDYSTNLLNWVPFTPETLSIQPDESGYERVEERVPGLVAADKDPIFVRMRTTGSSP